MMNINMLRERLMQKQGTSNNRLPNNPLAGMQNGMKKAVQKRMDAKCKGTRCGSTRVKGGW